LQYHFEDSIAVFQYLIVPEPKYGKSGALKIFGPFRIVTVSVGVLAAVEFNGNFAFEANEIENVVSIRMLSAGFAVFDLSTTKALPETTFRVSWRVAKLALQLGCKNLLAGLSLHGRFRSRDRSANTIPTQPSP